MQKYLFAAGIYFVFSMALGMSWYMVLFKELYADLGIYNRSEPIIPLGMSSMLIQAVIISYCYPRLRGKGTPLVAGIKYGLLMGLFMFTTTTLAAGAKTVVSSMPTWLAMQTAFHMLQFVVIGAGIGLVFGHDATMHTENQSDIGGDKK